MPVSEQVGRPFVELNIVDFLCYMYGEQKTNDMLEAAAKAGEASASKSGSKRKASQVGMINYGADGDSFNLEVEAMRKRYSALSKWLVHLMVEKRGGPAAPAPAAAAAGSAAAAAGSAAAGSAAVVEV